ncbi:MAG: substrate-binding domain-containing protein [Puniceicoccaceae bacterium]
MPKVLMLLGSYDIAAHSGIARAAKELGWHLDVSVLKTFRLPENWRGDGIICSLNNNPRLANFVRRSRIPAVDLSIWRKDLRLPRVVADNEEIGRLAAEHLRSFGHRNFVWFALTNDPVGEARCRGFREGLGSRRMNLVRLDRGGGGSPEVVGRRLSEMELPVACFAKSDDEAAWLMNVTLEVGLKVPEDVAILGVDNNPLICNYQPVSLSSVNHDLERIGYEGARLLGHLMQGGRAPEAVQKVKPNGVTRRESTDLWAVSDPLVREALETMRTSLRKAEGVDAIAGRLSVSRRLLEKRFQAALGVAVHQKRLEMRLEEGERQVRGSDAQIEDIAVQCGFCHAAHFSTAFRKKFGLSPSRYRRALD